MMETKIIKDFIMSIFISFSTVSGELAHNFMQSPDAIAQGCNPTITNSIKNHSDRIEISLKDSGSGIPEEIKNKIFRPFFTTKHIGQGTGMGQSCYSVKVHFWFKNLFYYKNGGVINN
jgi:sensor histidine kinase regulating citrate/malate metabolism